MKIDIILAGVGGQGILSIATVIGEAALRNDLYIKQAEVHGMSQRGGAVYSHLRLSDRPVASDLIPIGKADLVLSVEPMEALRYLPWLSADGWVVANTHRFVNIDNYPANDLLDAQLQALPKKILLDADAIAGECGNTRASNMATLGAALPVLGMKETDIENAVSRMFARKGEAMVELNLNALRAGWEAAKTQL